MGRPFQEVQFPIPPSLAKVCPRCCCSPLFCRRKKQTTESDIREFNFIHPNIYQRTLVHLRVYSELMKSRKNYIFCKQVSFVCCCVLLSSWVREMQALHLCLSESYVCVCVCVMRFILTLHCVSVFHGRVYVT